jgi:7,8-dihydro-6-hydroxymethylpterin dimethyltransferase
MHKPIKYLEKAMSIAANGAWQIFCLGNNLVPENPSFTPRWSDKPLLKSREKSKPPLGWPRTTDSLCPRCVPEIRQQIVDGKKDYRVLVTEKPGEIKAQIIERDGRILMVKDCPLHGHFEDVISIDPQLFRHLEEAFPGRDIRAHNDEKLHNHGSSTIKHGRGSVLTVDLTNRCNMMCDPCFMDANQVGFVHELAWDDIKTLLDNAFSIKPRRQMSVQFSGGEPTMSPIFWMPFATPANSATTACRPQPTASSSPRARSSRGRPRKRVCATRICNSTASATRRIPIATSGTCST